MKKKLIRYGIALGISLVLAGIIWFVNRESCQSEMEIYRVLCDATFAVGGIFICIGLLFMVSNAGVFDMLHFGIISFISLFKRDLHDKKYATYLEYKEAKRGNKIPWIYLAVIGTIYIAVSFVFLKLYSSFLK